jgi:hypothetical protein
MPPVRGADFDKLDCSVKLVPGDAAFYGAMLRNKEQIDAVLTSKAWARLTALPSVKMLWARVVEQLDQPLGPLSTPREIFKDPDNRQVLDLLGDLVSQEVFFYGGANSVDFLTLAGQLYGTAQVQRAFSQLQKHDGEVGDSGKEQARALLEVLAQKPELVHVPDVVVGFRVRDTERARAQLARLEKFIRPQIENAPPLKGRLQRAKVGDGDFLTLTLDGGMVPWDEIPLKDLEEQPGQFDAVLKKLREMKLTVALGVSRGHVLFGLGSSAEHLARFGPGRDRLVERPELKPLARFADRRLTGVSYLSKDLVTQTATTDKEVNDMVKTAKGWLPQAGLTDRQQERISRDLDEFAKDVARFLPRPGAVLSFSFLTGQGQESYAYDWGQDNTRDASKPLTILDHFGGSPLFATAGRSRFSPDDYRLLVKWVKVFYGYGDEYLVPQMEPDQREKFQKFMKEAAPLFRRLDDATGQLLLPALADGQAAFVVDAKLTSKQWVAMLPATEKPLGLPLPALVLGVSDAARLRQAVGEYRAVANRLLALLHQYGDDVPELQVPEPRKTAGKGGELYAFSLPEGLPLDKQIEPTAGLSGRFAVVALSPAQADWLLAATPLAGGGGPLADPKKNRAAAAWCDWAAAVDVLTPWVDMAMQIAAPLMALAGVQVEDLPGQVRTVLEILKVFRNYASETYLDGGAWVTHGALAIEDVK